MIETGLTADQAAEAGRAIARMATIVLTATVRMHVWPWLRRPAQRFLLPDWLAITIGHHIFSWRLLTNPELVHELVHVGQWQDNGWRYVPRYLAESRANGYRGNRFEVEAYAAEAAVQL